MKYNFHWMCLKPPVVCLWMVVLPLFILTAGSLEAGNEVTETKELDNTRDSDRNVVVSSVTLPKVTANNGKLEILFECEVRDKECEKDKLSFEAIRSLHLMIDDDHNGNVDLSESDEFLRDELQYTDGFDRQELFHNNDKQISVDDLWKAWKHSAVYNWTVDDVIQWLVDDVDLPQYSQTFHNFAIDGSVLPRLVNSTSPLLVTLGIRNPVHKQKLSLKAMDTVLFGAPKRLHSYAKDVMLFMAILLAIGISWFACLHHRYSQTQVKKMMKDLEALQKAEDALKKLSNELADAEKTQVSMPAEKQEELRMLRQNSLRLKVPHLSIGDKSPTRLNRDSSNHRHEGDMKLQRAEEELANLREALSEAENRLETQQQMESQWSVPCELQVWLQLTHELEQVHFNAKRQAAERQLLAAKDGCEKIKKRKQAFFGPLRMAHSNSLDDIDQSILDARAALEEVKQDLQERLHRWHTIEILCGFPILNNSGLSALKQALGRDTGNGARMQNSMMAGITFEENDEDLTPSDESRDYDIYNLIPEKPRQQIFEWAHRSRHSYWTKQKSLNNDEDGDSDSIYNQIPDRPRQQIFAWAHRSRHSYWTKKKSLNDNRDSESVYNQIPDRPRQQIFAWAHRSRLNNWMKKKSSPNGFTTSTTLPASKSATYLKQQPTAAATGSLAHAGKASSSGTASGVKNGSRDVEPQGTSTGGAAAVGPGSSVVFQLGDGSTHQRSHSSASLSLVNPNIANNINHNGHAQGTPGGTQVHHGSPLTQVTPAVLRISNSSGNLLTNHSVNRTGSLTLKMFSSASGNHLSARAAPPQANTTSAATANASADSPDEKLQQNDDGQAVSNNGGASADSGNVPTNKQAGTPDSDNVASNMLVKTNQLEDVDTASLGSAINSQSSVILPRGRHEHSPELDLTSQESDSLHEAKEVEAEIMSPRKNGKKKTLLPKFLHRSKGKQKTA